MASGAHGDVGSSLLRAARACSACLRGMGSTTQRSRSHALRGSVLVHVGRLASSPSPGSWAGQAPGRTLLWTRWLWTAVLSCATAMALIVSGLADSARRRRVVFSLLAVAPLASGLLVGAGIPAFPALIGVNEAFQIVFRLTAWALVMAAAAAGLRSRLADAPYVLCAAIAMALAFAANLLDAGAYEPLYGLWQNGYAALAAMAAFAALIVARGRRMVAHEAAAHELDVQLRAAEQTLAHIRASEDATRVMRHDLKHHANALAMLATEGEWDRARAYACELSEGLAVIAPVRYSRNLVVNAACAAYLAAATEQGVEVRCDVRVPEKLPVRDGDLAVLLSNLLSNAVEGCWRAPEGSRRALRFDADWNGEALCMRCENSAPEGHAFWPHEQARSRRARFRSDVHAPNSSTLRRISNRSACRRPFRRTLRAAPRAAGRRCPNRQKLRYEWEDAQWLMHASIVCPAR